MTDLRVYCMLYNNALRVLEVWSNCACLTNIYFTPLVCGILVVCVGLLHLQGAAVIGLNQSG